MSCQIAIDGPAGAGKSTAARRAAEALGFLYVDTGAMYRAIALHMLRRGLEPEDEETVSAACREADVTLRYEGGVQQIYLNGENVSAQIREEEVSNAASVISGYPAVREKLLGLQRRIAEENNVIMDGRDIGTSILPDAGLKIYLTASVHTRALRRYRELKEKGAECDLAAVERDISERDYRDMHREIAPLRQAPDAVLVDSSQLGIREVAELICAHARRVYRIDTEV